MPEVPIANLVIGNQYVAVARGSPGNRYTSVLTGIAPATPVNPQCPCPQFGYAWASPDLWALYTPGDPTIPANPYGAPAAAAAGPPIGAVPRNSARNGKGNDCAICQDQPLDNTTMIVEGPNVVAAGAPVVCGHKFHRDCINTWVNTELGHHRQPTCPTCRANIVGLHPARHFNGGRKSRKNRRKNRSKSRSKQI